MVRRAIPSHRFAAGLLAAMAWLCLTCAVMAQSLTFPALTGRVVDEAGLLSPEDRAALTASLAGLEAKTTDQLVVVTLKSLQGTAIEDYGYQLGRQWKIGQKDKDNGVLLIVAPTERAVRIEVGYGLESTLTDAATKVIIESAILPRFKAGDFPGGIKRGADQIIQLLTGEAGPVAAPAKAAPAVDRPTEPVIVFVFRVVPLLVWVILLIYGVVRGRGLPQVWSTKGFGGGQSSGGASGFSGGDSGFSGGGGSFGGGGSSGRW